MPETTLPPSAPDDFHKRVIHERLPAWVRHLKPAQVQQLRYYEDMSGQPWLAKADQALQAQFSDCLSQLKTATFALARALQDLQPLAEFAESLLAKHLWEAFTFDRDLRTLKLVRFSRDWNWSALQTDVNYRVEPLLQAALQNFPLDLEWQPESVAIDGDFRVSQHLGYQRYHYTALPFTASQFGALCHDLDLGQRYQRYLDTVLGRAQVRRLGIEARRQQLQLDLLTARLRDGLQDDSALIASLCDDNPDFKAEAWPRCHRFSLFGVDVLDTVLIYPGHDSVAVFLYLPGVNDGALTRYPTLGACQRDLVRRLNRPEFRRRFMGFIQHDKHEHFASVLQRNFTGDTLPGQRDSQWTAGAETNLHWHDFPVGAELFGYLQDRHHRRLLNEARLVAVPSAEVDETARQQRLHYWESLGLDALGVAAFFIPAAGQLMAAVFIAKVLDDVYEGVQAWQEGDIDTALAHVKAVAIDGVSAVVTGVALEAASRFSGRLMEVLRADGTPRLWNGDLEPYRVMKPPMKESELNSLGQCTYDGRRYVALEDAQYEVIAHPDGQRWQVVHPKDAQGFMPVLEHNREGAWREAHEAPLAWPRQRLLRRLGHLFDGYTDEQLEIASRISGITRDELLDVYLRGQPAPTRLLETLRRLRRGDKLDDPLDAVFEGVYLPARASNSSDRLALWSLPHESAWPANTRLELRAGDRNGPLLERAGERFAGDLRLIVKVPGGYRAVIDDQPQKLCEDLVEALESAMPELTDAPLALKGRIVERAQVDRDRTMSWLWSGHSYGWNEQGRLLGGTGRRIIYPRVTRSTNSQIARYRTLYPRATDDEARSQLAQWTTSQRVPHLELRRLERELEDLRTNLAQWVGISPMRFQVQDALLNSWRRMLNHPSILDLSALELSEVDFVNFPSLGEGFRHVEELNLNGNEFTQIPDQLIVQFPGLQCFWGGSLQLEHIPDNLGAQLTALELTDNLISWSPASQLALEGYPRLQMLNLCGNPLDVPLDVGMFPNLEDLSLFDTNLERFPHGLDRLHNLERLDLSANAITELPDPLGLSESAQRALSLEHNPLSPQASERIEAHFRSTGIDLLVSDEDYSVLLLDTDPQTLSLWQTVSRLLPLRYRRNLRQLGDTPQYLAARATTRRRFWYLLRWLTSPLARQSATAVDASQLFRFELTADLTDELAFPGMNVTDRQRSEHMLSVAVSRMRFQAVTEAVRLRVPGTTEPEFEALRALTLQRVTEDPRIVMRIAPTQDEPVESGRAGEAVRAIDAQWIGRLQEQLLELNGTTVVGRDALLSQRGDDEYVYPYWINHLRQRYAADFEHLQEQAHDQLQAAEASMNEGAYLSEANRLRRKNERDRELLLDSLTRSIAEGTQTRW